jgi:hypothetical protein
MDISNVPIFNEPGKITPVCVSFWNLSLEELYRICMLIALKKREQEREQERNQKFLKKYKKKLKNLKNMKLWGPPVEDREKFKLTIRPIEEVVGKE